MGIREDLVGEEEREVEVPSKPKADRLREAWPCSIEALTVELRRSSF